MAAENQQSNIELLCINTIRTLSMDGVQKANSGHPGTPMALAPLTYVLYNKVLQHNPRNPQWFNRDRFVLSNGHASMLQYSTLHVAGYDVSLEDLQNFRQWGSKTPGHPENTVTDGVETTTGPLGQGLTHAVGMAIAEAHLAAKYNKDGMEIVNHRTIAICGDGDLMEGVSHEAASLAGHLKLGKLTFVYDDNHITIEGDTNLAFTDNTAARFEAYGWQVINLGEKANDTAALEQAFADAASVSDKPTMIIIRTHIGYGSPNMQDTSEVHGSPLGVEEIKLTKKFYGWDENKSFYVPGGVMEHMQQGAKRGQQAEADWDKLMAQYKAKYPQEYQELTLALSGDLPADWDADIPTFSGDDKPVATRKVGGAVLNAIAGKVPWLIGGSADLSPSTNTFIKSSGYFQSGAYQNRNVAWGIREFTMGGCCCGMALHGGTIPYGATFFVFSDYARPAMRLAALMEQQAIFVMTHDSIGLGEDGPTHQPIEHLASLRAMPEINVIRPADANETAQAWRAAMLRKDGPTVLVLSRQNLPVLDQSKFGSAEGVLKGAYVLSKEQKHSPDVILIATGSEVQLALSAQAELRGQGIESRVVSMPCWELFAKQSAAYQEEVLPKSVTKRISIEAGSTMGWGKWTGNADNAIGIDHFGASAPASKLFSEFGFTVENIVSKATALA